MICRVSWISCFNKLDELKDYSNQLEEFMNEFGKLNELDMKDVLAKLYEMKDKFVKAE